MAIKSLCQKTEAGLSEIKDLGAKAENIDVTVTLEDGSSVIHTLQKMIDDKEIGSVEELEWTDVF